MDSQVSQPPRLHLLVFLPILIPLASPRLCHRDRRGVSGAEAQAVVNAALQARATLQAPTTPGAYAVADATGVKTHAHLKISSI